MLDFDKVRALYFDPPPYDPERIPSREELTARYERERFDACVLRGGDPEAEALGPHGFLIGGDGKPPTVHHVLPEVHARLRPLPLTWFDHPRRHTRTLPPGGIEEAHLFFRSLSHGHLAGHRDRPSGARLRRHFQAPELSGLPLSLVRHVLACIRGLDLNRLLAYGGLSLYEIARAIHLTGIRRVSVTRWINQYAIRPTQ
ncbi:MAG: hypothetical protein OXU64_07030 [Gemmatimonadota bacterium]|nr:hypothetical protein [Gemmatimonadota bacterium]